MLDAPDLDHVPPPGRQLPHNVEAEMAVLGAILVNPRAYERVSDFLRPEHFALKEHRPIFEGVRRLADQDRLADVVTMKSYLNNAGALDQVGGTAYLNRLVDCAVTVSNAGEYGRLIHDHHVRREVIATAEDVLARAYNGTDDMREAAEALRSTIEGMSACGGGGRLPFLAPGEASVEDASWLVKGTIPRVGTAVVYGPSGEGKSFVVLDLAMAVSRGEDWRGRKTERGAVLYLSPDGGGLFTKRIVAYCQHHEIAPDDHGVFTATCGIDLLASGEGCDTDKVLRTIEQIEKAHGVAVVAVVVDTASRAMPGGDENAAKDMTRFIGNLGRIGDGKRAVIVVHHSGKDASQGMRGSTALPAAIDCTMKVDDGQIELLKVRDGVEGVVGGFRLQQVEIGTDADGDAITSCVVVATDVAGCRARGPKLADADRVALRTIANLIAAHGQPLPSGTGFPTSGRHLGVSSSVVSEALRGNVYADRTPVAAKRAAERVRTKLQDLGLIGVFGGIVWLPQPATTSDSDKPSDTNSVAPDGIGDSDKPRDKPSDSQRQVHVSPETPASPPASAAATTSDNAATCRRASPRAPCKQPSDNQRHPPLGVSLGVAVAGHPAADGDGEEWTFPKENLH